MKNILHSFTKYGYAKIPNVFDKDIINKINKEIIFLLGEKKVKNANFTNQSKIFNDIINKKIKNKKNISKELYKIQSSIFNHLENQGYVSDLLNFKNIKSFLYNLFFFSLI